VGEFVLNLYVGTKKVDKKLIFFSERLENAKKIKKKFEN